MDAQRVLRPTDRCARHLHHLAVQLARCASHTRDNAAHHVRADVITLVCRQYRARLGGCTARRRLHLHIQHRTRHGNRQTDTAHKAIGDGLARIRSQGIGCRRHRIVTERLHAQRQDRVLVGDARHHAAYPRFCDGRAALCRQRLCRCRHCRACRVGRRRRDCRAALGDAVFHASRQIAAAGFGVALRLFLVAAAKPAGDGIPDAAAELRQSVYRAADTAGDRAADAAPVNAGDCRLCGFKAGGQPRARRIQHGFNAALDGGSDLVPRNPCCIGLGCIESG